MGTTCKWKLMFVLLSVWMEHTDVVSNTGESDVTGSHQNVTVVAGHDALLPCCPEPPTDVKRVEWTRNEKDVHVTRKGKDLLLHQDKHFKGRTSILNDTFLHLTNVTQRDAGNYTCNVLVQEFPGSYQERKCSVPLVVTEPPEDIRTENLENKPGGDGNNTSNDTSAFTPLVIVAISVSVVVVVVVIIAVGIWKCREPRRNQNNQNTNEVEIPLRHIGDQNAPGGDNV